MENVNSIRIYREQTGFSQEQLGEQIGVTRQTIAAWERGEREPSLLQISKIARVLGVSLELLLDQPTDSLKGIGQLEVNLLFRADEPSALTPYVRDHLTQKAVDYAEVEALLGEVPAIPALRPLEGYDETLVEELATEVRDWLGVGELTPIGDVLALLESKGLKVIPYLLPAKVSGFSAYTEAWGAVIFVNEDHPTERKFFTALHEVAHLIFHRREYKVPQTRSRPTEPREKAANHLAGAVLMPRGAVLRELHAYRNRWLPEPLLKDIKRRYGISLRTILYRAEQAELITKQQKGQQLGVLNKKYGLEDEPEKLPLPERLNRLERLVYTALIEKKLTVSRSAEILGEHILTVREKLSEWLKQGEEDTM
ncbi:helix-turn-helix domain-containing protein [Nostoc sp.]